jgi:hypothetical protein
MMQADVQNIQPDAEADRKRADAAGCCVVFTMIAAVLAVIASSYLIEFSAYEMYNRQGTVVDAWARYDKDSSLPFVVMETVTYHKTEGGAVVLKNCTLKGEAYNNERVAGFAAHEVMIGQQRHMHVPKHASVEACMFYDDLYMDLQTALLLLYFPTCISGFLLFRAIAIPLHWVYKKWFCPEPSGSAETSTALPTAETAVMSKKEMTARSSRTKAYTAVSTHSAHGGVSVAAQVVHDYRDDNMLV